MPLAGIHVLPLSGAGDCQNPSVKLPVYNSQFCCIFLPPHPFEDGRIENFPLQMLSPFLSLLIPPFSYLTILIIPILLSPLHIVLVAFNHSPLLSSPHLVEPLFLSLPLSARSYEPRFCARIAWTIISNSNSLHKGLHNDSILQKEYSFTLFQRFSRHV